jgi:tetratricopeptide (TPR) repeat protein
VISRSNLCRTLTVVLLTLTLAATAAAQSAEMAARANQAKQAMAADRFDEAAAIYREILKSLPDEPGILMNLGMALAMSGQSKEAIQPLSRALELQPTLMPAALFLGQSHLDLGQPEQAMAPLQKFVTAEPANLQARQMLASASLMAGRHQQAAAEFRTVAQQAPDDAKGWYGLVQSYDALSQETLDALSKTTDAALYEPLLIADALESEGKLEEAFRFYKQSLQGLPNLRATHEALARIYTKTGHAEWAAQQTAKARQLAPACAAAPAVAATAGAGAKGAAPAKAAAGSKPAAANPKPPAPKGAECEFRAKRYLNAIAAVAKHEDAESLYWKTRAYAELASGALAKLTAMKPSQELHELRAELYRNQRRHLQSVTELKAALTFAPDDPRLRRELAKSLYYARDWDASKKLLEELIKEDGRDPELRYFYGDVLLQSQQAEAALPHLKAAVDGAPDMPPAHAAYGRALVQLGRFAEAIPHLEQVLAEDEDGSLHYQLARAYQGTGQAEKAKPLLQKYQEMQRASQPAANSGPPPAITPPG